ncbi:unnamed protein product [Linum tenue]|uniref:Uncharacterized protein n=1 Tax=Linum tenue TaxID=586396 RepID=A0AAV0LCJ6_9ROSI|nr:unnamed protein product [Linum tenue]
MLLGELLSSHLFCHLKYQQNNHSLAFLFTIGVRGVVAWCGLVSGS